MKSSYKNKSFSNEEIKFAEGLILSSIMSKYNDVNGSNLNYLPILENKFTNRIYEEKNKLDTSFPKIVLEPFPLRNYFQIGLFFKLFLLFILFGFNIKGYSFSIFIAFLIIYYWYYVNADIQNYYDTKIQELKFDKLNEEEMRKLIDYQNLFEDKKDDSNNSNKKDQKDSKDLSKSSNDSKNLDSNEINNEIKNENSNHNIGDNNPQNNNNDNSEDNKNKNKEKEHIFDHRPNVIIRICYSIIEISVVFILSMYPAWCDSYEERNPIVNNIGNENQNNENINNERNNPNDQYINEIIERGIEEDNNYELYNHNYESSNDYNSNRSNNGENIDDEIIEEKKYKHQIKPIKFNINDEKEKIEIEKNIEVVYENERKKDNEYDDIKIEDLNEKKNK